jgi:hypothetical protein
MSRLSYPRVAWNDKVNLAIGFGNMADDRRSLGQLRGADQNLRRCIALCQEARDERSVSIGHQYLLLLELANVQRYQRDIIQAEWLLGWSLVHQSPQSPKLT